jgi:ubiquitin carboxyl-terminal hydrolase 5/13
LNLQCEKSGETENLWLNLSTGFIGGGRKNWDGSGGSNGALDYFMETGEKYPLVVKLGTITNDIETADCYSYAKDEDGPVKIPNLAELLQKRGINVASLKKTVKSTAELEVELNATYAFDAITEAGSKLVPVSGAGLQGLQNLGNSCYINSIVQMLFSGTVQELLSRYGTGAGGDLTTNPLSKVSPTDAPNDLLCQSVKLASALSSGTFSAPVEGEGEDNSTSTDPKYRLPPRMFKHVVGSDHEDFCTGQQQDSAQYLQYLLEKLDRAEAGAGGRLANKADQSEAAPKSSSLFAYKTMSRLVCSTDNKIKYNEKQPETILSLRIPMPKESSNDSSNPPDEKRHKSGSNEGKEEEKEIPTISFQSCLDAWSASHTIDGLRWSHLSNAVAPASEENRFVNFPRYLMVQIQRYELGPDWIPRKLEVNIDMPEEIDLNSLKSLGPQDGEDIVTDADGEDLATGGASSTPQTIIDEGALAQLMDMGFSMNGCKRALSAVGGSNAEAAMNWIFEHNSDPDFNDPLPEQSQTEANSASHGPSVDEGTVSTLVASLGCFTTDQVRAALKECGGQADRAADWLFSHMDDLDGAIARLQSNEAAASKSTSSPSISVEDGDGKYSLVGMVSHIGKNTGSGHYVAHLKKDGKWVIFNDEKVALSETPPIPHAYVYLFQRTDCVGNPNVSY